MKKQYLPLKSLDTGARRPVQIAVCPEGGNDYQALFVLADDGTLWSLVRPHAGDSTWNALPALPSKGEIKGFPLKGDAQ